MKKSIKILKLSDELHELILKLAGPSRLRRRGPVGPHPTPHMPRPAPRPTSHIPSLDVPGGSPTGRHRPPIERPVEPTRRSGPRAPRSTVRYPEGFKIEKAPQLKGALNEGLKLQIDRRTNTYAIDPSTKALKIEKIPSDWIQDGKITPEAKSKIKQIKKELALTAKEIKSTQVAQRKAIQSFRRGVKWELFKQKLPARAAAGAALLTGVAGLYIAFSGKSNIPNATPEQSKLIFSVIDAPKISSSVPPASTTIKNIDRLIANLNNMKSTDTNKATVNFIDSHVSSLQNMSKVLNEMPDLQSIDTNSIAAYRSKALVLRNQIATFNAKSEKLKEKLESFQKTESLNVLEEIQTSLYAYNDLINQEIS